MIPINIRNTITVNTRYNVSLVHIGTHVPCSRPNINLPNPYNGLVFNIADVIQVMTTMIIAVCGFIYCLCTNGLTMERNRSNESIVKVAVTIKTLYQYIYPTN